MSEKNYQRRLNKYNFSTNAGFNSVLLELRYEELKKFYVGDSCLEMGCADGKGTSLLLKYFKRIVAVDGSGKFLNMAKMDVKDSKVEFVHSLFEELDLKEKFDVVILPHILEHVSDPIRVLQVAKKHVSCDGLIIIDVPNALSLHRQLGVQMGMIKTEYTLNEADLSIGHQRIYDIFCILDKIFF